MTSPLISEVLIFETILRVSLQCPVQRQAKLGTIKIGGVSPEDDGQTFFVDLRTITCSAALARGGGRWLL